MHSPTIPTIVSQHAEECVILRHLRSVLVRAPHVRLHQLKRHDGRIAAHLDGLIVAGPDGWKFATAALASPNAGETFAVAVLAIHADHKAAIVKLLAVAEAHPPAVPGVISAFGWASSNALRGIVAPMLASSAPFHRLIGLVACALHRVNPGPELNRALNDVTAPLRARALRAGGELGRRDLLPACLAAIQDDEEAECRYHATRTGVLLGDRDISKVSLQEIALSNGPHREDALRLLLKLVAPARAREILKTLLNDPAHIRTLIRAIGAAGDPHFVPWLISRMSEPKLARLAGESFSLITGIDLSRLDMETKPPEGIELGPSDDPDDDNVAMDEDDGLPWPDVPKISHCWQANSTRFTVGTRYFIGQPPTPAHALQVLKDGRQRQRMAAAEYLSLLTPGIPLFNTAAPAWRQQRLLSQMGA